MGKVTNSRIKYYDILYTGLHAKQPSVTKDYVEQKSIPLKMDAKCITLAQYDPATKDFVTAHRLKDYRRKQFNLLLLPEFTLPIDDLLADREGWDAEF